MMPRAKWAYTEVPTILIPLQHGHPYPETILVDGKTFYPVVPQPGDPPHHVRYWPAEFVDGLVPEVAP